MEVLNAYVGWGEYIDQSMGFQENAKELTTFAATKLGMRDEVISTKTFAGKVDKCLAHVLDQQSEGGKHFVDSREIKLGCCRDRSVATAVARPMEPLSMERETRHVPFVGPPTSSHNGYYLICTLLFLPGITRYTAVDERTIEIITCFCPQIWPSCFELWTTNDGITYKTTNTICCTRGEIKDITKSHVPEEDPTCMCKVC